MKEIRTEIIVNASKENVWKVLTNFESYSEWNPFIVSLEGEAVAGTKLKVCIAPKGGKTMDFRPTILEAKPNEKFEWLGKTPMRLFNGQHYFIIKEISDEQVKFIQGEYFTGWLVKPIMKKIGNSTQQGFIEMNKALKQRAERGLMNVRT